MKRLIILSVTSLVLGSLMSCQSPESKADLSLWTDNTTRERIEDYVAKVTNPDDLHYIPVEDRIAVFDNDGTLWTEFPAYNQLLFAIDRLHQMANEDPDWEYKAPYSKFLDSLWMAEGHMTEKDLLALIQKTHSGISTEEFITLAEEYIKTADHPVLERKMSQVTYSPMVQLIDYLEAHDFTVFIVSGGGIEFMRAVSDELYGIPEYRIVGSRMATKYNAAEGTIELLDNIEFIDDKEGKPLGINTVIGKRPVFVGGNSDGDLAMMEYASKGTYPYLNVLVHHTDSEREFAYDRDSHVGRLDQAMQRALEEDWVIVDMASDWSEIFADEK